jgi:ubiquitin-like-conjugating enzyme ATG3
MVTRGVPCLRRATSLAYTDADEDAERLLSFGDGSATGNEADEWVETHAGRRANVDSAANPGVIDDIPDLDGLHEDDGISAGAANLSLTETPDLDDIPDMEEDLEEGDDAAAAPSKAPPPPPKKLVDTTVLVPFLKFGLSYGSNLLLGRRKRPRTRTYSQCERTMS